MRVVLLVFGLCSALAASESDLRPTDGCEKVECKGPLRYYKELGCSPVYTRDAGKCCPARFSCAHIEQLEDNRCYANNRRYEINQKIRKDEVDPCDHECTCRRVGDETKFVCEPPVCSDIKPLRAGCYYKTKLETCCQMIKVCPSRFKWFRVSCEFEGTKYNEGDIFQPAGHPHVHCQCEKGFNGKIAKPYCRNETCHNDVRRMTEVRRNCAPLFFHHQQVSSSCNYEFICPEGGESVKHADSRSNSDNTCSFGKLNLHVGDEVVGGAVNKCVRCVCELPPAVTCVVKDVTEDHTCHPAHNAGFK